MICLIFVLYFVSCTISSYSEGWGSLNNTIVDQGTMLLKNIQGTTNATFQPGVAPQINLSKLTRSSLSISGTTFNDQSGDGFRMQNEPGLPGWTIILERDGEKVRTTTNDSGWYSSIIWRLENTQ